MARLGPTDVFGPLRIDNQIISTETTGTPAFVIGSTTVIPNLNADLLDGYHASTSPTANTVMLRDANGYSYSVHHNLSRNNESSAAASYIYDTGDGWLRKKSLANARAELVSLAASGTRGGVQIGFTQTEVNRAVLLSAEKMYVNVPKASSTVYGTAKMTYSAGILTIDVT